MEHNYIETPKMPYIEFSTPITYNFTLNPYTKKSVDSMKSLFSDNSQVFYRKGALASGGVGTVRNVGSKRTRT